MTRALFCTILLFVAASASAQTGDAGNPAATTKFDGRWKVTLTCPAQSDDEGGIKGYTHVFPADVKNGQLRGVHGTEGEPSYHLLQGTIAPDGSAALRMDGIVNRSDYAAKHAARGKPYTWRVTARFEPTSGTGVRAGSRPCEFRFDRS
jgi:hypothetical protein